MLNIGFDPIMQNAQICGMEIRLGSNLVVSTFPFYISAGPAFVDTTTTTVTITQDDGTFILATRVTTTNWVADAPYVTGGTVSPTLAPDVDILDTERDGLYRKERWGNATMAYKIPIVNGNYQVVLHFAELLYVSRTKVEGGFGVSLDSQHTVFYAAASMVRHSASSW
jgi:Malectin domain